MPNPASHPSVVFLALQRFSEDRNNDGAREALVASLFERIENLSRKMLHANKVVERYDQTHDISQVASVKIWRALAEVEVVDVPHLIRLMALHIRRTLLDRYRTLTGPQKGLARNQVSDVSIGTGRNGVSEAVSVVQSAADEDSSYEQHDIHELFEKLPPEQQEVLDLVYYNGLTHAEAAKLLDVSEKTIGRRWLAARLSLAELLELTINES